MTQSDIDRLIAKTGATVTGVNTELFRAPVDEESDEADFQWAVIKEAKRLGWHYYHTTISKRSKAGWPDLALWKSGRGLHLWELKTETGRLSAAQLTTIETMAEAGVEVKVFRPKDWPEIMAILTGA